MYPTIRQRDAVLKIFEESGITQEGLETLLRCGDLEKLVKKYLNTGIQPGDCILEVDDRIPMSSLIDGGGYRCVSGMIKRLHDDHEKLGRRKLRLKKLHTPEEMRPEEVAKLISGRGLKSARLPELLHLGKVQSMLEGHLLALDSLTLINGINWIPMIDGDANGRELTTWEFLPGLSLPPADFLVYEVLS